jgi:signal transduction histidine kinase
LLLGEKRDGGFYSLEEIEIARASGERLADIQASAELSRRLVILQRQRLTEGKVLDRQARRVLHDDVLPRLHAILLDLSGERAGIKSENRTVTALAELHRMLSNLLRELPADTAPEVSRLGVLGALRQVVDGELKGAFDQVDWLFPPEVEQSARDLPALKAEVLFYAAREAIRNSARHARNDESAEPLHLRVKATWENGLEVSIEDNGIGLGGVTTKAHGNGQGLTLHSTLMAVIGGSLTVESYPGEYTRVLLSLPEVES